MAKIIGAPTLDDALQALSECVMKNEISGEKTLVFCEDKLTLLAERAVLAESEGTFLTEVTAFARFLSGPNVLSKEGSVMMISSLIEEHQKELVCFSEHSARAVYETIAQLAASRIDGEMLRSGVGCVEGALRGKLLDLAFLYETYMQRLKESGLYDESRYLSLLPEKLSSELIHETHIIFFGFSSFTRQAQTGIAAAVENAKSVTGIFLAGKSECYTNEGARVFHKICQESAQTEVEMRKSSLSIEAKHLENGLFAPETLSLPPMRTQSIRRFTAADEEEEYQIVAALIKKYISEGMRYSDFAVLVPGNENFLTLEKVFESYKIPYFAERKRAFSEHPFCKWVLSVLSAVADGVLPDDADQLSSNYYFGREGAEYRNYLLKFGAYRGAVKREIKDAESVSGFDRENLVACRERMLKILSFFPKKATGSEYTAAVRALWEYSEGERKTETLKNFFMGAERRFLEITPLNKVMYEIETIAGERVFSARNFAKTLENGLKALEISMIPPSLDAVFAGDLTESRFARVRVVFATGLTEEIPRTCPDTAVITDRELDRMKELKVEIEPSIMQVNARARESLALNLCAFSQALYLSYPLKQGGKDSERSEVLQYAEALFEMPPMPDLFPYDCCEEAPATLELLELKHNFETGLANDQTKYRVLYAAFERIYGVQETEKLVLGGGKERVPFLEFEKEPMSPTMLEKYFECPYSGFVSRMLKLREREERALLDMDTGNFVHAVLETCAKEFNRLTSESECRTLAKTIGVNLLKAPKFSALWDTEAGRYTAERLLFEGEEVSAAAYRSVAQSAFRVSETEGKISIPELFLGGKTDRIDRSDEYVRVVDYKTGSFDDSAAAYYTGRKLQLELYLRAASRGGKAAGAFYFPASDEFSASGKERWRMCGFYSGEDEVLRRMDGALEENCKSLLFEGVRNGKFTDKGMKQEDFEDFLDYSLLIVQRAENEIRWGNIAPSPYEKACLYCKLNALCGFTGVARKEERITCADITKIVRRERGEE